MKKVYYAIGLMSGTSLDGLDIAFVKFLPDETKQVDFEIQHAETIAYPEEQKEKLAHAHLLNSYDFLRLHNEYGDYLGKCVNAFVEKYNLHPDFIASHGHTIFHQPQNKFTFQLGNGASLCAQTKNTVISDFRALDVALAGHGAPLVPIGDLHLFPEYKYCLNLGGFANVSIKEKNSIHAFDIGPCNYVLNYLARTIGKTYDIDGQLASQGKIDSTLYAQLNALPYFALSPPKSLGREWFELNYQPIIDRSKLSTEDKLRTTIEQITYQIATHLSDNANVLVTGGGALNQFFIQLLEEKAKANIILPDAALIHFKESLIFAYLGLLRLLKKENTLKAVTGAEKDSTGGIIHYY